MCGRFVMGSPPDEIARYFDAEAPEAALEASYNVAPTNDVYVVLSSGEARRLDTYRWGLVPPWAKDLAVGSRMINARAETVATKNAYRSAFKHRRCIIPADGFFEWKAIEGQKRKQPHFIRRRDGEPLAFAGLWERWHGPKPAKGEAPAAEGEEPEEVRSCCIVTGEPNEVVRPIHDRMPVMLPPSAWEAWLDPQLDDAELLGSLLVPAPASLLEAYPVSTAVNQVREKGPELILPADADAAGQQGSLL
jgi:putative SOS response-associated peptidase YedK